MHRLVRGTVLVGFAVSGFAAMVYQITWTRALIMAVGSTTYAFTCILAAFILGLAVGSLAVARWVDRWKSPVFAFGVAELLIGLVAVVIVPIHGQIPRIVQPLINAHYEHYATLMTWQFLLIIAVTFVPTFLMGAIFPLVTRALAAEGDDPGAATGRAYVVNTIGTIVGSFLAGFVLIRSHALGVQSSIILASILNGLVGLALVLLAQPVRGVRVQRALLGGAALLAIPGVAYAAGRWDPLVLTSAPFMMRDTLSSARKILFYGEGVDVTVTVEHPTEMPQWLTLRVNGKPDASTVMCDMVTMVLLGHVPALVRPDARDVCMVGLGSGISLGSLACHPSLERLDCVEISEDVIQAAELFGPYTYHVLTRDPRVHMILADGRNHLLLTDQSYDLLITQPSNPWMSGVSNLFTREYFELGRNRLRDGGSMAVWLQGYKTSVRDFQMVVHTLFDVFEHVSIWELAQDDFLMIASRRPQGLDAESFVQHFKVPTVWADLYRIGHRRPEHVLAHYVTAGAPLREWAAGAPLHTDDNARLEFSAPRYMYAGSSQIAEALLPLQRRVLVDLFGDPVVPPAPARAIDDAVAGRWARIAASAQNSGGDRVGALDTLLAAYARAPHDTELYEFLMDSRANIQKFAELASRPDVAARLAHIEHLPPPRIAPPTGATLAQIAAQWRAIAQQAAQRANWPLAAELRAEALDLEPDNVDTARTLVDALLKLDRVDAAAEVLDDFLQRRPDEGTIHYTRAVVAVRGADPEAALRHLEIALRRRAASADQVRGAEEFRALQGDPRFAALLATQPSSQPAPAPG